MGALTLLHVRGDGAEKIGYGRLGVQLCAALERAGVEVFDDLGPVPAELTQEGALERTRGKASESPTNVVSWVATPGHAAWWHAGQHASVFTMWEATRLPEAYRETMHEFETVVVPSQQNVELFSRYHPNVRYVPLGVDPADWHYTPRDEGTPFFRFMCPGSGSRKGTKLAYKAFRTVFPNPGKLNPVPVLVMKNPKSEDFYGPYIEMVSGKLPAADEIALYASIHCSLNPARGEGFGLQPLQAIAQGIPTILTDAHGHASFSDLGIGLPWTYEKADYFIYGDADTWWEPDFEALCEAMHDVYQNYAAHLEKAKQSAEVVAKQWTWDHTAAAFIAAHDGHLDEPYSGSGGYHIPTRKLYPVIVERFYKAEIAGLALHFEPWTDDTKTQRRVYWESSDVKRILFEAQVLHVDCLQDFKVGDDSGTWDIGLDKAQAERIPGYTAAHSYCKECGQKLNSGVTEADEIFAELEAAAAKR